MRKVQRIVKSLQVHEGAGFLVNRPFPVAGLSQIDPFLLIDEMGPVNYAPGEALGAPDHPHRGFETISYILEGGVFHEDSKGFSTELFPGDMQWMTAGRGVVHSELPLKSIQEKGGAFHGIQIWVNLPRSKKMTEPQYQNIRSQEVPKIQTPEGALLKVLSGSLNGLQGPVKNQTPILYAHLELKPKARWRSADIPKDWTTLAYVIQGSATVDDTHKVMRTDLVQFDFSEGEISFENSSSEENFGVLLLAGAPLHEPIARMGPFVMNTKRELEEAYNDYMSGRLGNISR